METRELIYTSIIMNIKLYKRLQYNDYTNAILNESRVINEKENVKNTLISEIREIMNIFGSEIIDKKNIEEIERKISLNEKEMTDEDEL